MPAHPKITWPFRPLPATAAARQPAVLLPVRLETRFVNHPFRSGQHTLRVRIYPDEIHADAHDERLTDREVDDGLAYRRAVSALASNATTTERAAWEASEKEAWKNLLSQGYEAPRAAWVVSKIQAGTDPERVDRRGPMSRGAIAYTLPDRWVLYGYRRSTANQPGSGLVELFRLVGRPVPAPLQLTPDLGDGKDDARWVTDFDEAVRVGMALEITDDHLQVSGRKLTDGVDLLLVVGLKCPIIGADATVASDGRMHLGKLLRSHRYTGGLGLVEPGTPTNNTRLAEAGYDAQAERWSSTYAVERGRAHETHDDISHGMRLTKVLGLGVADAAALADLVPMETQHLQGLTSRDLLAQLLGKSLRDLFQTDFTQVQFDAVARHFFAYVRPGGPYPALRVGAAPYGVLPVALPPTDHAGVTLLNELRDVWVQAIGRIPRVGRRLSESGANIDPDEELSRILQMDGVSHGIGLRRLVGKDAEAVNVYMRSTGVLRTHAGTIPSRQSFRAWSYEALGHAGNLYRDWVGTSRDIFTRAKTDGTWEQFAIGLHVLRMNLGDVAEWDVPILSDDKARIGYGLYWFPFYQQLLGSRLRSFQNVPIPEIRTDYWVTTAELEMLGHPILWQVAGGTDVVLGWRRVGVETEGWSELVREVYAAFELPAPETDPAFMRHFHQSLDALSHRLDAWYTSFATERLEDWRKDTAEDCLLGGYAWVEDLRHGDLDAETGVKQPDSYDYIHAPSMQQAAAAAVLRHASLFGDKETRDAYAVDLSSARVRRARWLLAGVRKGQDARALLGQQFERTLGDRGLHTLIQPLRILYPLGEIASACDGLKLLDAWEHRKSEVLAVSSGSGLREAIGELEELLDAVTDLLTAEGMFQLVGGKPGNAAAVLDMLGRGAVPVDPQVAQSPRHGRAVRNRVLLGLPASRASGGGWADVSTSPRASAEPRLDAWFGGIFGPASEIHLNLEATAPDGGVERTPLTVEALGITPIDLYFLALKLTEIEARAMALVEGLSTRLEQGYTYTLDLDPPDLSQGRALCEVLELASMAGEVLAHARPIRPSDLVGPGSVEPTSADDARALWARAIADVARARLDLESRRSSEEVPLALLRSHLGRSDRGGLGTEATDPERTALTRRWHAARALLHDALKLSKKELDDIEGLETKAWANELRSRASSVSSTSDADLLARAARNARKALLGAELPMLPELTLSSDVTSALGRSLGVTRGSVERWLDEAARARPGLAAWQRLRLVTELSASEPPRIDVLRLPDGVWTTGQPSDHGLAQDAFDQIVLCRSETGSSVGGLVIDAWDERIPDPTTTTGLAFHYDDPGAEAPQAILVALPPKRATAWTLDHLVDVVLEARTLTMLRGVTLEHLPELGPLLPLTHLDVTGRSGADETIREIFDAAGRVTEGQ